MTSPEVMKDISINPHLGIWKFSKMAISLILLVALLFFLSYLFLSTNLHNLYLRIQSEKKKERYSFYRFFMLDWWKSTDVTSTTVIHGVSCQPVSINLVEKGGFSISQKKKKKKVCHLLIITGVPSRRPSSILISNLPKLIMRTNLLPIGWSVVAPGGAKNVWPSHIEGGFSSLEFKALWLE